MIGIDGKVMKVITDIEENADILLNVSSFDAGVYFVQIRTSQGRLVQELIIE